MTVPGAQRPAMRCARSLQCRLDGGVTFGAPQQIDPDQGGNQFNPGLAATAAGRVDVAYLWDPRHWRS